MEPFITEVNQKISQAIEHLKRELSGIRAGRANPTLLEDIQVLAYGSQMKLMEVGTITAPQPSLLTVQVWDPGIIKDVEKAIMEANLGLNPSTEGTTLRVPIPPLSEERRVEFVKLSHQKGEQFKVEIRQIRQEARSDWDRQKESGEIGEDELFRRQNMLQDLVDKSTNSIDKMIKQKEEELMEI